MQREIRGRKVILPVWHGLTREEVAVYSPTLADKRAGSTRDGIPALAEELAAAMRADELPMSPAPLKRENSLAPVTGELGYKEIAITGKLHRYSLTLSATLSVRPIWRATEFGRDGQIRSVYRA